MRKILLVALLSLGLGLFGFNSPIHADPAGAKTTAAWPQIQLTPVVTTGLEAPVHLTHAGDGSGRLFIVEQAGRIRTYTNQLRTAPFLDITATVRSPFSSGGSEEGLLSAAFPPDYAKKGYFYVYYTNKAGNNQISRFHLGGDPNTADPDSEELIIQFEHPGQTNHNGGQMAFGPDGYLYIGTGDGGGGGDPLGNAQNPRSLLGKLLRIDVEGNPSPEPNPTPQPTPIPADYHVFFPLWFTDGRNSPMTAVNDSYSIPPDNPFVGDSSYRGEIWALGLRNPWRFSFDRQTGDLYVGDVGQGSWEEVDFQPASSTGGENYGWDILEGETCYGGTNCDKSGFTMPVYVYSTQAQDNCAVTGGFVYRGQAYPSMQRIYFFGDYCSGVVLGMQQESGAWTVQALEDTNYLISSFGEDQSGELYVVDRNGGVYRITAGAAN
jgi:glucose/arabinose dehydrogenase